MDRKDVPRRRLAVYVVLLVVCLGIPGCGGRFTTGTKTRHLAPSNQPSLDTYELVTEQANAPSQRAIVFYVPGSMDTSVTRVIGAMAGFVMMDMRVVLVERRGVQGDRVDPAALSWSTKPQRVADVRAALDAYLVGVEPSMPVLLVGASEGGDVAAAVAADDPRVSHLVLLGSGGGLTQAEELALLVRRRPGYLGIASEDALEHQLAAIRERPDTTDRWLGLPFCRCSTFLWSRPLDDLVRFRGHALLIQGARDENVPVESARILRDGLARGEGSKFHYVEHAGRDHRFRDASGRSMLPLVEIDMVRWMRETGLLSANDAARFDARVRKNHPEWFASGAR